MPKRTVSYRADLLEKLTNPVEAAHYLNAAMDDSLEMFLDALKDVAQAHQMSKVAKEAGVARESLYRSLSSQGNPTLEMLHSVLRALKLRIEIASGAKPRSKERKRKHRVSGKFEPRNILASSPGQMNLFEGIANFAPVPRERIPEASNLARVAPKRYGNFPISPELRDVLVPAFVANFQNVAAGQKTVVM